MPDAVIVSAVRTAAGKAPSGSLRGARPAEMAARQKELLKQYRANGVLGEAAYHKALAAIDDPLPTTQPTQPSRERG